MDKFKECQIHHVGIGGMECSCCNSFHGKSKSKLNRMARSKIKQDNLKLLGEAYAEAKANGTLKPKTRHKDE